MDGHGYGRVVIRIAVEDLENFQILHIVIVSAGPLKMKTRCESYCFLVINIARKHPTSETDLRSRFFIFLQNETENSCGAGQFPHKVGYSGVFGF